MSALRHSRCYTKVEYSSFGNVLFGHIFDILVDRFVRMLFPLHVQFPLPINGVPITVKKFLELHTILSSDNNLSNKFGIMAYS